MQAYARDLLVRQVINDCMNLADRDKQRTLFSRTGQDNEGQLERYPKRNGKPKNTASICPFAARR